VPGRILLAVAVYLLFRVPAINRMPVFVDESAYLYWAQLVRQDPGRNILVSMTDPKPPLHVWLLALALGLAGDPLRVGRLLSVALGALTVPVILLLAARLDGLLTPRSPPNSGRVPVSRSALARLFAVALFVTSPYLAVSQRMSLVESLFLLEEATIAWLSLVAAETFWRRPGDRRRQASSWALLGLAFGAAFLTRQNVSYVLLALPALGVLVVRPPERRWDRAAGARLLLALSGSIALAVLVWLPTLVLESDRAFPAKDLRTKIFYHSRFGTATGLADRPRMALENTVRMFLPLERGPDGKYRHRANAGWFWTYLTPPVEILSLGALVWMALARRWRLLGFLLGWILVLLGPIAVFGGVLFPRYAVAAAIPLLLALACALASWLEILAARSRASAAVGVAGCAALFALPVADCLRQIRDPLRARWVAEDRAQFVEGWTAGAAVQEAERFLRGVRGEVVVVDVVSLVFPNLALDVRMRGSPGVQTYFAEWPGLLDDLREAWPVSRRLHLRTDYRPWKPASEVEVPGSTAVFVVSPDPVYSAEAPESVESLLGGLGRSVAERRRFQNPPGPSGEPGAGVTVLRLKSGPPGAAIRPSSSRRGPDSSSSEARRSARPRRRASAPSGPGRHRSPGLPSPPRVRTSR
jgi:4-amino-4-deoxy-L-arabinose transferase-like glycosyltransferase